MPISSVLVLQCHKKTLHICSVSHGCLLPLIFLYYLYPSQSNLAHSLTEQHTIKTAYQNLKITVFILWTSCCPKWNDLTHFPPHLQPSNAHDILSRKIPQPWAMPFCGSQEAAVKYTRKDPMPIDNLQNAIFLFCTEYGNPEELCIIFGPEMSIFVSICGHSHRISVILYVMYQKRVVSVFQLFSNPGFMPKECVESLQTVARGEAYIYPEKQRERILCIGHCSNLQLKQGNLQNSNHRTKTYIHVLARCSQKNWRIFISIFNINVQH